MMRWNRKYLPQWKLPEKKKTFMTSKKNLFRLFDDAAKQFVCKMGRITKAFTSNEKVMQSIRVKTAKGEVNWPVGKLPPLFYYRKSDIENMLGRLTPLLNSSRSLQTAGSEFELKKKLIICQIPTLTKIVELFKLGLKSCPSSILEGVTKKTGTWLV